MKTTLVIGRKDPKKASSPQKTRDLNTKEGLDAWTMAKFDRFKTLLLLAEVDMIACLVIGLNAIIRL